MELGLIWTVLGPAGGFREIVNKGLAKEMGYFIFKELKAAPSNTSAYFMFNNYSPGSCRYLTRGQDFTKNLELQWSFWETFQLDRIVHLRTALDVH